MTEPEPRPRRRRAAAEPEKLAPGLYGVGRFGDQHDLTDPHHVWLSQIADADLYAIEGYLRHALARAEHERLYRETDHTNRLTRALDLRDAQPNLPRRMRMPGVGQEFIDAAAGPPSDILERVREGLAENLASDPDVRDVIDRSASEFEKTRDAARMGPDLGDDPDGDLEGYDGALSPEVAAKVDEALADPGKFVKRTRPARRTGGEIVEQTQAVQTSTTEQTAGRPAQPWDNDTDDPWEGIGGSGA